MADGNTKDTFSQVSLLLVEIFQKIGVNKKIRCRRKNTWKQYEELASFMEINVRHNYEYGIRKKIFGSQIEGSSTPGLQSDVDEVYFIGDFLAVRNIQDAVPGMQNLLMITDEHTFPGYFKLQKLITTPFGVIPLYRGNVDLDGLGAILDVDHKERVVLKASGFLDSQCQYDTHGPARTRTDGLLKIDYVWGIKVNNWVQEAIPWLMRHRQCSFIMPYDFKYFLKKKAFLVPVGHTLSDKKDHEWRISFTSIERELMWRMNKTQMACYILMKMIIKCFITPIIGECLSSYHCKTALFYLVDNTPKNLWKPNNLLSCLRLILTTISLWVKEGLCPNYFIPQENMFLGKLTGPVRQKLHHILVSLIDMEFKYLLLIECDQLGQALSNSCSRLSTLLETPSDIRHLVTVTEDKTSLFSIKSLLHKDLTLVCMGYIEFLKDSSQNLSQGLIYTLIHGFQTRSRYLKDMLSMITAFFSSHVGCQLASSCFASQNFHPQDIDKAHKFLLLGTVSDVTSGKLKLAGFYLKLGYPAQAEAVLSAVEQKLGHHVSEVEVHGIRDESLKYTTMEKILSENLTTSQTFKTCIAASVTYLPSEFHITLPPLCYEMLRSVGADPALRDPKEHYWYDWAVVDARPYLYFLQHQTYSALGMDRHKLMALKNLVLSLSHERTRCHDTCLNMLAYCLRQEGNLEQALLALSKSLQIKPEHNAAVWQICDLLNQLYHS